MSGFKQNSIIVSNRDTPVTPTISGDLSIIARNNYLKVFDGNAENTIIYESDVATISSGLVSQINNKQQIFLVDNFGPVGTANDVNTINAAVLACINASGGIVSFSPGKTYYSSSLMSISADNIQFEGNGATIICDVTPTSGSFTGTPFISFCGYPISQTVSVSGVTQDLSYITCTPASSSAIFAPGDYVYLTNSDSIPKWDGTPNAYGSPSEILVIESVVVSSGVINFSSSVQTTMTNATTITKYKMVEGAKVSDLSFKEVYCGVPWTGTTTDAYGPTAPNIVDFMFCANLLAQNLKFDGWNLVAISVGRSFGGDIIRQNAVNGFNREVAGTSNAMKCIQSSNIVVSEQFTSNVRHSIDWVTSFHCKSMFCNCSAPDDIEALPAFFTHGLGSRDIRSYSDTAYRGGGWGVGNPTFAADYDVSIINPTFYGDTPNSVGISIHTKSTNVNIIDPIIHSKKRGIEVGTLANNVRVLGGFISTESANDPFAYPIVLVERYSSRANSVVIDNVEIRAASGSLGIAAEYNENLTVRNCKIVAGGPFRGITTTSPSGFIFENNDVVMTADSGSIGAIRLSPVTALAPTKNCVISNNRIYGTCSSSAISLYVPFSSQGYRIFGNRAYDTTNVLNIVGASVSSIISGGGVVEDNNSSIDIKSVQNIQRIQVPSNRSGGQEFSRNGITRWKEGFESGTDNYIVEGINSSGVSLGNFMKFSHADGIVYHDTASLSIGNSNTPTSTVYVNTSGSGVGQFVFRKSGVSQFIFRFNPTSDYFELNSRDVSGGNQDSPITISRAAAGNITIVRPLTTNQRILSTVSSGTAPFQIASNTVVTNLNADLLDGQDGTYYTSLSNSMSANALAQATSLINTNTALDSNQATQIAELSGNSISQASQIAAISASTGSSLTLVQVSNASANSQVQTTNNLSPLIFQLSGNNSSQATQIESLSANSVSLATVSSASANALVQANNQSAAVVANSISGINTSITYLAGITGSFATTTVASNMSANALAQATSLININTALDSNQATQIAELSGNSISQATQIASLSANSGNSALVFSASANAQVQTTNNLSPLIFQVSGTNISQSTQISELSGNSIIQATQISQLSGNSISQASQIQSLSASVNALQSESTVISAGYGLAVYQYAPYSYSIEVTGSFGDSNLRSEVSEITANHEARITLLESITANIPTTLDSLTDVVITSPVDGQTLKYVSGQWINQNTSGSASYLSDLLDVTLTTPLVGQSLYYDGSKWINKNSSLQGSVICVTGQQIYTISHDTVNPDYDIPVVSLVVPSSASFLFVQGITNVTSGAFSVILSNTPDEVGYKINWHINGNVSINATTGTVSGDYATVSLVAEISAGLQSQIDSITGGGGDASLRAEVGIVTGSLQTQITNISSNVSLLQALTNGITGTQLTDAIEMAVSQAENGFENRTDSVLNWNNSTRTLTVSATNGSFDIWANGKKYTKTIDSYTINANASGSNFIYYNQNGVLTYSNGSAWDVLEHTPIALVYWDGSKGIPYEERHGIVMDKMTHKYLHFNIGTRLSSLGPAATYSLSSANNADLQISLGQTSIYDEDIALTLSSLSSGGPYTVIHKQDSANVWDIEDNKSFPYSVGISAIMYNQNISGNWQLTELNTTDTYVNYYVIGTPSIEPIHQYNFIPGQTIHTTYDSASAESVTQLNVVGIPATEFCALYKLTYRYDASYTSHGKVSLYAINAITNNIASLAGLQSIASGVSTHNSLQGLQGGATAEYYHISEPQHTFINKVVENTPLSGDRLVFNGNNWTNRPLYRNIGFSVTSNSSVITPGIKAKIPLDYISEIVSYTAIAEGISAGNCQIDIWRANGSIPTSANSILGGYLITLSGSSEVYNRVDPIPVPWSSVINDQDIVIFNVNNNTYYDTITVSLKVKVLN
jgi:hypothetical protein